MGIFISQKCSSCHSPRLVLISRSCLDTDYFALPSTNCSYSKYLLRTPRSQSELGEGAGRISVLGFLFGSWRSGCESLHEMHPGSLREMGSRCQHPALPGRAAGGFWSIAFPPLMTKGNHFSCISLKKRFLRGSFPTDKVSVPLPGRQAGALKTIEECDGQILWIAESSRQADS